MALILASATFVQGLSLGRQLAWTPQTQPGEVPEQTVLSMYCKSDNRHTHTANICLSLNVICSCLYALFLLKS